MSDMEQSDIVAPVDPAASVAPAAEPVAPAPAAPSAEELQAEIEALQAQVEKQVAELEATGETKTATPFVLPVVQQAPSSTSPTQQPEAAPAVAAPLPLEDAVRGLLVYVKARRTVGDSDLDAALADVEAALPALPVEADTQA